MTTAKIDELNSKRAINYDEFTDDEAEVVPVLTLITRIGQTELFTSKNDDPRPYITVDVVATGRSYSALVDTGAMVSVLGYTNESELEEFQTILLQTKFVISTVDGSEHKPKGRFLVEFWFANQKRIVPLIVVKTPVRQLIVGINFCNIFGIVLAVNPAGKELIENAPTCEAPAAVPVHTLAEKSMKEEVSESVETQIVVPVHTLAAKDMSEMNEPAEIPANVHMMLETLKTVYGNRIKLKLNRKKISVRKRHVYEVNTIRTSTGRNDEINDVTPEKHTCVYRPHELTNEQQARLQEVLEAIPYTAKEGPLNCTNRYVQRIDTGSHAPEIHKQYPLSPYIQEEVLKEVANLLGRDIIKEIRVSPWRWPILWVRKPSGGGRICVDARGLNKITVADAYPSINADAILRDLRQAKYISSLDMTQAFHQIPIHEDDQLKTSFSVGNRLFCYKRAIMGFKNSPADLTKLLDDVFNDLYPQVYHYVDDFIIMTETFDEHIRVLSEVARRLNDAQLTISAEKSKFCHQQLTFLGYILSEKGLQPNPERIQSIVYYKPPETVRDVRRLVGLVNWYRKFIPKAAELLAPLTDIIREDGPTSQKKVTWTDRARQSFEEIKTILTSEPILAMADFKLPFKIYTDASLVAGAAVLTQVQDGQERVIQYHSVKFTPTQQNYSATERELLAVLAGVERFRPWVDGRPFEVITDHSSIQWLTSMKNPHGKLTRWAVRLQAFDIKYTHRAGKLMDLPDALSRAVALINIANFDESNDPWYKKMREKAMKNELDRYKIHEARLYRRGKFDSHTGDRLWVLAIPREKVPEVLKENHDAKSHPGFWKTLQSTQANYFWPAMNEEIHEYVSKCEVCKLAKTATENTQAEMGIYRDPGRVGRMISIDFIGQLPSSKIHRHQVAVVAIDCFSKYVFTKSFVQATAANLVDFVEKEIIWRFETPEVIICDNGTQFESKLFGALLEKYKIRRLATPLYYAQANPVESTNKTLKTMIRAELIQRAANHEDWATFLPFVTMNLNTTPHTVTGFSPHYVCYGHEKSMTGDEHRIIMDANPQQSHASERRELIYNEAAENNRAIVEQGRQRYNMRANTRTFKAGDEILVKNRKLSNAGEKYTKKLAEQKFKARIVEKVGTDSYRIANASTGEDWGIYNACDLYTR